MTNLVTVILLFMTIGGWLLTLDWIDTKTSSLTPPSERLSQDGLRAARFFGALFGSIVALVWTVRLTLRAPGALWRLLVSVSRGTVELLRGKYEPVPEPESVKLPEAIIVERE